MAAEVSADLNLIQDEDILRRMWAETEDFGRKKEIRARMYKLREQRLRDFYTTGEVVTEMPGRKHTATTHAESIGDQGFLTMKSKEIRDSESPTRDFNRRGDNNYWTSVKESSYTTGNQDGAHLETRVQANEGHGLIIDGNTQTKLALASQNVHESSSKSDDNMSCKSESLNQSSRLVSASKTQDDNGSSFSTTARQEQSSHSKNEKTSATSQSTSTKWSSSSSSSRRVVSSSSQSYQITSGGEKILIKDTDMKAITSGDDDSKRLSDTQIKHSSIIDSQDAVEDSHTHTSNLKNVNEKSFSSTTDTKNLHSVRETKTNANNYDHKTEMNDFIQNERASVLGKEEDGVQTVKIDHNERKTDSLEADVSTVKVTSVNTRERENQETQKRITTDSHKTEVDTANVITDQKIMNEIQKLDTYLSTQNTPGASTPVSPHSVTDGANWTVVSNTDGEFVYQVDKGVDHKIPTTDGKREPIKHPSTLELPKENTEGQYTTTYQNSYKRISVDNSPTHEYFVRTLRASPDRSTPSPTKRASSKGSLDRGTPSPTKMTSSKGSLDRGTPSPTKMTSSKGSLDRGTPSPTKITTSKGSLDRGTPSPTKITPSKGSLDRGTPSPTKITSSKGSLDRSSPERKLRSSPTRKTPEKERRVSVGSYTIEKPQETRRKISEGARYTSVNRETTTKTKRKFSSTQAKSANKARVATPGASPSTSPTRPARARRSSSSETDSDSSQLTYNKNSPTMPEGQTDSTNIEVIDTTVSKKNIKTDVNDTTVLRSDTKTDDRYGTYDRRKKVQEYLRTETDVTDSTADYSDKTTTGTRALQPSPREASPEYSSEGSVSRELKGLKSPVKSFLEACPERSAFEPIKSVHTTSISQQDLSTNLISEERRHISKIRSSTESVDAKETTSVLDKTVKRQSTLSPQKEPRSSSISPCSSPDRSTQLKSASPTPDTSPDRVSKRPSEKTLNDKRPTEVNNIEDRRPKPSDKKDTPTSTLERSPERKGSRPAPSFSPERDLKQKKPSASPERESPKVAPEKYPQKKSSVPSSDRKSPEKPQQKKSFPTSPERDTRKKETPKSPIKPQTKKPFSSPTSSPERQPKKTSSSSPDRNIQKKPSASSPVSSPERRRTSSRPTPSPERSPSRRDSQGYLPSTDRSPKRNITSPERISHPKQKPGYTTNDTIKQNKLTDSTRANSYKTNVTTVTTQRVVERKPVESPEPKGVNRITRRSSIPRAETKSTPKKSKENIQPKPASKPSTPVGKRPVSSSPQTRLSTSQTRTDTTKTVSRLTTQTSSPKQVPVRKPTPAITVQKTTVTTQIRKTPESPRRSRIPVEKRTGPQDSQLKSPVGRSPRPTTTYKKPQTQVPRREVQKTISRKENTVREIVDEEYLEDNESTSELIDITEIEERDITDNVSLSNICQKNLVNKTNFIDQEKYIIEAENLEDESPPDEFYADIDEDTTVIVAHQRTNEDTLKENRTVSRIVKQTDDTQINRKFTQKREIEQKPRGPATPAKPTTPRHQTSKPTTKNVPQQSSPKHKPTMQITKAPKSTTPTKVVKNEKLKVEQPKRTPGKKTPQGRRTSSSSSSSEDEDETTITNEELKLTRNNNQLYTEEVDVIIRTDEEADARDMKTSTQDTHLKVVVQHPRSSRESSPDFANRGIPVSATSEDGESIPRYADYVSEPEDVEIFDYSNLGPRRPIPGAEKPEKITDLDEDEDTQIKLDVSVADRVSKFMETTRIQSESTPQEPSPVNTGSPASVRKAKALFENIAKNQSSPPTPSPKKIDIYEAPVEPQRKASLPKEKLEQVPKREITLRVETDVNETISSLDRLETLETEDIQEIAITELEDYEDQIVVTERSREPKEDSPEPQETPRKPSVHSTKTPTEPTKKVSSPKKDSPHSTPKTKHIPEDNQKKPFERKPSVTGDISSKKAFFENKAKDTSPKDKSVTPRKDVPKVKPSPQQKTKTPSPEKSTQPKHRSESREETTAVVTRRESVERTTRSRASVHESPTDSVPSERPRSPVKPKTPRESPVRERSVSSPRGSPVRERPTSSPRESPERKSPRRSVERESPERSPLKTKDVNIIEIEETSEEVTRVGKFGVTLRRTSSATNNKVPTSPTPRRPSAPSDQPEVEIEEIFQLELLEEMLLKAVAYDERRRIRAQIRLVKRQLEETTTTQKTTRTFTTSSTTPHSTPTKKPQEKVPEHRKSPERREPSRTSQRATRKSVERQTETTIETTETSRIQTRRDAPKSPDRSIGTQRKIESVKSYRKSGEESPSPTRRSPERHVSGTKRTIESVRVIRTGSPESKAPARKSPERESPERRTIESVKSLRKREEPSPERRPKTTSPERSTTTTRTVESVKTIRSGEKSPERRRPERDSPERPTHEPLTNGYDKQELHSRQSQSKTTFETTSTVRSQTAKKTSISEVRETCPTDSITSSYGVGPTDENGRPLFGLKALRRTNTNKTLTDETEQLEAEESVEIGETEEKEISDVNGRPLFGLKALQTPDPTMPAQPSAQLKELVEKHQQFVLRETSTTESQPRQKPKAKLRDSFISQTQDEDIMTSSVSSSVDDAQSPRGLSLRSIIQKHEGASSTGSNVRSEIRSSSTVVKSQSTMSSDGKVSVTKDVIRGEMVAKNGEEPVGKVTKSHYSYQSPEDKQSTPKVTSTTTTSVLGQRRRSSGPKILEVEDAENFESEKATRRYSKEYTVDEGDNSSQVVSQTTTRRGSRNETEKTATTINKFNQNVDDDWKKSGKFTSSTTVTSSTRRQSSPKVAELTDDCEDSYHRSSSEKVVSTSSSKISKATNDALQEKPGATKKTVVRGDSVRALQHKFQQATVSSTVKKVSHTSERRDSKTKVQESRTRETKSASPVVTTQVTTHQDSRTVTAGMEEPLDADLAISKVTKVSQSTTSFLDNNTKVTGVQDVLSRMRNANLVVESDDTVEDAEARALLNKFLGASVILQGMEQGMRAQAAQSPSSAALVSQVEKQRVMSTTTRKSEDIDEISDEKQLRILLEACSDYEDRRKIRARLRSIMADQKAPGEEIGISGSDGTGNQRQGECLGLRWKGTSSAVDDSGTESGEDLRLLSPEVLKEIQSALSRLEGALPGLEPTRRDTVTQLVNRLQSCLRIPPPSVPPVPPPRRFPNKKLLRNRHTVGVTREELADARRWLTETDMQRQSSASNLSSKEESIVTKVFRPVKFSPPTSFLDKEVNIRPTRLQKMTLIQKVFHKPILHSAGYFMEPAPQVAAISYIEPYIKAERSLSDTGSLLDYDPSLNLFTPEQSVQIAVHKAAINKQISQEELKRRESSDDGDISSAEEDTGVRHYSDVSSAQRLLQLASESSKKNAVSNRYHSRCTKKQKIKRANTIDIPKPASFYDHSSGEEYGGASADEGNHSDYPIGSRKLVEKTVPPPSFEPKTENDLKFLAFLKQANESAQAKVLSYNPSARGGKHWNSRFTNIRTAFEGPESRKPHSSSNNPAKLFWQNSQALAQNQVPNKPSQLHQPKLPWSVKTEKDGVVVGSLTVAKNLPGPINQFTHASKSAFKPVEKKSHLSSPASGTVKQLAAQKFSSESSKPVLKQILHQEIPYNKSQHLPHHGQKVFNPKNNANQQFSSSSSATHRHYNIPQNLSQYQNQPSRKDNVNSSKNLEPTIYRDHEPKYNYNSSQLNSKPITYKTSVEPNKYSTEPSSSNIKHLPSPSSQSYTSNVSVTQKPFMMGTKTISQDPSLIKYPPAETYLKIHPKFPDASIQQENLNAIHDTMHSVPPTIKSPKNYASKVESQNLGSVNTLVPSLVSVPLGKDYIQNSENQNYNPVHHITLRDESVIGQTNIQSGRVSTDTHIIPHHSEMVKNQKSSDNKLEDFTTNGQTNNITFYNGSCIQNENPQFSQYSGGTTKSPFTISPSKEETSPSDYRTEQLSPHLPHYPLLSPNNLPLSNISSDRVSPVRTYFNNVNSRQISSLDLRPYNISPIGTHFSKSPSSLKCEDDDSISASPYQWGKESNEDGSNRSSPLDCTEEKAVSRVMGQAQLQQAVTVNNRTRHRFDNGKKIESELRLQVQQSARQKALSPSFPNVLQKSESWHQIVKEQMQQAKQAPPLPKLSKAKSSHALAFPKQFEAALNPDKLSLKQSTVNQYLSQTKVSQTSPKKMDRPRPTLKTQASVTLNIDDLDNVDEAFESIFQESNKKRNSK